MMKNVIKFKVGDKVFAKVKGYPPWPATIIEDQTTKFNVRFYGTGETGIVKSKDLFYYLQHKNNFTKSSKRKDYNEAIEEIEIAIEECGGSDGNIADTITAKDSVNTVNLETVGTAKNKRKRSDSLDKTLESPTILSKESENDELPLENKNLKEKSPNTKKLSERPKKFKSKGTMSVDVEKEPTSESTESAQELETFEEKTDTTIKPEKSKDKDNPMKEENKDDDDNGEKLTAADIKIITEEHLATLILYADIVKKDENNYKKKPIESRRQYGNETVLIKLPSGKYIGIKYNRDPPPPVTNEYDRAIYDATEAKTMLSLKKLLEEGKCNPEYDRNLFIMNINIDEPEIHKIVEFEMIENQKSKINKLKIEQKLVQCEVKIKTSLTLDRAEPRDAVESLQELLPLDITPLMLKKHPHVVEMVRRLKKYIGNVSEWNYTREQCEIFENDAEEIRAVADELYIKFSQVFNMSNETLFWDVFNDKVENFKDQVENMPERAITALTSEPDSRQSHLERMEECEELISIVAKLEEDKCDTDDGGINRGSFEESAISM